MDVSVSSSIRLDTIFSPIKIGCDGKSEHLGD